MTAPCSQRHADIPTTAWAMLASATAGAGAAGLSDVVYRQLVVDRRDTIEGCGSPTAPQPMPSTPTSPAARSRQAAPTPPRRPARWSSPFLGLLARVEQRQRDHLRRRGLGLGRLLSPGIGRPGGVFAIVSGQGAARGR